MTKAEELAGLVKRDAYTLSSAIGLDVEFLVEIEIERQDAERVVALIKEGQQIRSWPCEVDEGSIFGFQFDDGSVIVGDWDDFCQAGGAVGTGSSIDEAVNNLSADEEE